VFGSCSNLTWFSSQRRVVEQCRILCLAYARGESDVLGFVNPRPEATVPIRRRARCFTGESRNGSSGMFCAKPRTKGWLRTVTYYAARDPDFTRDCAYWQHCGKRVEMAASSAVV